jgi:hypothetical protein
MLSWSADRVGYGASRHPPSRDALAAAVSRQDAEVGRVDLVVTDATAVVSFVRLVPLVGG